jgi:hypothetical protein
MVLGYLLQAVKYAFHTNKKYVSHYITNQNRTGGALVLFQIVQEDSR